MGHRRRVAEGQLGRNSGHLCGDAFPWAFDVHDLVGLSPVFGDGGRVFDGGLLAAAFVVLSDELPHLAFVFSCAGHERVVGAVAVANRAAAAGHLLG